MFLCFVLVFGFCLFVIGGMGISGLGCMFVIELVFVLFEGVVVVLVELKIVVWFVDFGGSVKYS